MREENRVESIEENREKILLHCCCGPCSTASVLRLLDDGWEPVLFFGNSNIFPEEENLKRLEELKKVAKLHNLTLIASSYNHGAWREHVKGFEAEKEGGERCRKCFEYNLSEAERIAKSLGICHFTTTLTVSRFKNSAVIFSVGRKYEGFEEIDFKKKDGFAKSVKLSKEMGLYRQKYCGCEFSLAAFTEDSRQSPSTNDNYQQLPEITFNRW